MLSPGAEVADLVPPATVNGLVASDHDVCMGDRYRIGDAEF